MHEQLIKLILINFNEVIEKTDNPNSDKMRAPNFKIVELKAGVLVKNVPGTSAYPRSRFHHFKDEWESKTSPHYNGTRSGAWERFLSRGGSNK